MVKKEKNILIIVNTDWFFLLHRVAIAIAFQNEGYNVVVATKDTGKGQEISKLGFVFININFDRKGLNPFKEFVTLFQIYKVSKMLKPVITYQVTIKPIIYGLLVTNILKNKTINTICGLGYVFTNSKAILLKKIIFFLYKFAFKNSITHTFFENKDDRNVFLSLNIIKNIELTSLVNGAGVDLAKFSVKEKTIKKDSINIILPTRMLWDKGIKEFVETALLLQDKYINKVYFKLYGMVDQGNPESIPEEYLNDIEIKDYLKWFGFQQDMVGIYNDADVVVLPSYYGEGLPTVLAEACAMGKPIITTDSVGCKECVDDGVNGFMVSVKSVSELAKELEKLIVNEELRIKMGRASRKKAVKDFDQVKIVGEYKKVFNKMIE